MSSSFSKRLRLNFLVDVRIQITVALLFLLICVLVTVIVGFMVYYLIYRNNYLFARAGFQVDPVLSGLLVHEKQVFLRALVSIFGTLFFLLFSMGIFISHRIAGPIYAIQREMKKVIKGFYDVQLRFRVPDELKSLLSPFNELCLFLKIREGRRRDIYREIEKKLGRSLNDVDILTRDHILLLLKKIEVYRGGVAGFSRYLKG